MCGGDALEEDFGFGLLHRRVHPLSPSCEALLKRHQTIHIFVNAASILYIIPSTPKPVYIELK